jgi:hypothetical protein
VGPELTGADRDLAADRDVEVGVEERAVAERVVRVREVQLEAVADVLDGGARREEARVVDGEAAEVVAAAAGRLDVTGVLVGGTDAAPEGHAGVLETLHAGREGLDVLVELSPVALVREGGGGRSERRSAEDELLHWDAADVSAGGGLLEVQKGRGGFEGVKGQLGHRPAIDLARSCFVQAGKAIGGPRPALAPKTRANLFSGRRGSPNRGPVSSSRCEVLPPGGLHGPSGGPRPNGHLIVEGPTAARFFDVAAFFLRVEPASLGAAGGLGGTPHLPRGQWPT